VEAPDGEMDTIGFIGIGKIGLPICAHLIKAGYRVLGYSRRAVTEFENSGGTPARSPKQIGAQANIVFASLPSDQALEEVMRGGDGLICTAHPGQIVVELGSHPIRVKQRYIAPLAEKGAVFLDGEVSGTPGMVAQRKGVIYLGGDRKAVMKIESVIGAFADHMLYLGPFGAATNVKLVSNLLVALHIAGTAQAMAIGLHAGVKIDLLIEAIATGSGGSTQFGIRAPWMAERRFTPQQGSAPALAHYLEMAKELADEVGAATPLLDCLSDIYRRALPAIGERDVAAILEFFESQGRCAGANAEKE
jgi:3-hydroxyisobutyrate dehydrogenase-like beta-hydroxyacid dehydrogenase